MPSTRDLLGLRLQRCKLNPSPGESKKRFFTACFHFQQSILRHWGSKEEGRWVVCAVLLLKTSS